MRDILFAKIAGELSNLTWLVPVTLIIAVCQIIQTCQGCGGG